MRLPQAIVHGFELATRGGGDSGIDPVIDEQLAHRCGAKQVCDQAVASASIATG